MVNLIIVSNVAESLSKGMKVIAQGTPISRKWTDKQGWNRESVELKLTDIDSYLSDNQVREQKIARQPRAVISLKSGRVPVSTPYPSFDPCRPPN